MLPISEFDFMPDEQAARLQQNCLQGFMGEAGKDAWRRLKQFLDNMKATPYAGLAPRR